MTYTLKDILEIYIPQKIEKSGDGAHYPNATIGISATGDTGGEWTLKFRQGRVEISNRREEAVDCRISASAETWGSLLNGKMHYIKALLLKKITVNGDKTLALKITTSILS